MPVYPSPHAYEAQSAPDFAAITPSDSVNIDHPPRGVYVGSIAGGATIIAVRYNGSVVTFTGVIAGSVIPIRPIRINSTGTTASSLVALY